MSIGYAILKEGAVYIAVDTGIKQNGTGQQSSSPAAKIQYDQSLGIGLIVCGELTMRDGSFVSDKFFDTVKQGAGDLLKRCEDAYNVLKSNFMDKTYIRFVGKKDYQSGDFVIIEVSHDNQNSFSVQYAPHSLSKIGNGWFDTQVPQSSQEVINDIDNYIQANSCSYEEAMAEVLKGYATNNNYVSLKSSPQIVCVKLT